jgi:hypothetical protein
VRVAKLSPGGLDLSYTAAAELTPDLIEEAELLLKGVIKNGELAWLQPVFKVAHHFIRGLSKKMRAEPDQVRSYDKRYVEGLKGKVFGKGQSESSRTLKPKNKDLPTLEEAQASAIQADTELNDLLDKRTALRAELKEHSKLVGKRRLIIRQKIKKAGDWRVSEKLFHSPIFRRTQFGEIRKVGRSMRRPASPCGLRWTMSVLRILNSPGRRFPPS